VKVIKPLTQALLFKVYEDGPRAHLSIGILSFFSFEAGGGLLTEIDLAKFAPAELGDTLLDGCMPKPKAEALVVGRCHPPGGEPVPQAKVQLRIGTIDKTLTIVGDRFWEEKGGFPAVSETVSFTEMPITWENAYGGPEFGRNPLGKGHAPVEADEGPPLHALPNVETPDDLVVGPKKVVEPAGFAPIDQMWPQRMAKAGTYDDKWREERFPGLPEDIDRTFFNAAPEDQQIEGFFRGDEVFAIGNMHPEKPVLSGRLPGYKSRCFVNRRVDAGERFEEIETRLDTVWLFPHAEKGVLIHRAVTEVATDDAEDVLHLMIAYERMADEPKPRAHYRETFLLRTDAEEGHLHALDETPLIPPGEASGLAAILESGDQEESPLARNMARKAEKDKAAARERVVSAGLDPDEIMPEKKAEAPPDASDLPALTAFAKKAMEEARARNAETEAGLRKKLAAQGMDLDRLMAKAKQAAGGPPKFSAAQQIATLRKLGMSDPATEEKLRQAEVSMKSAYRKFAHQFPPAPAPTPEEAVGMREAVEAAHAEGKSLARQDLTGADLSGLKLPGVDLEEAILEGADLSGADLSGARLNRCVLARADLAGTQFAGARMSGAGLGAAKLAGADFKGADLTGAAFGGADLGGADLTGATLDGADFMEATLAGADLSRATLVKTTFLENDLTGARFVGADLGQCMFIKANLEAADFSGARLCSALFVGVSAQGAVFTNADMTKVCAASDASFLGADFRGANLTGAGMRESDFRAARFEGASLEGADLSESDVGFAGLAGTMARHARFDKSDLTGADLTNVNLYEGSLMKAVLFRTDLRGANLHSAECMKAKVEETDLRGAKLTKTKIAGLETE
jgi:uncharacterized protein YjbI with pentapeptide repeats